MLISRVSVSPLVTAAIWGYCIGTYHISWTNIYSDELMSREDGFEALEKLPQYIVFFIATDRYHANRRIIPPSSLNNLKVIILILKNRTDG